MTVRRLAISLDADLARAARKAAGRQPMSTWLADAARRRLRAEGLLDVVRGWEGEHGVLNDGELKAVARKQRRRPR
jgi:hypothetical protein